ncbi:MAG: SH3 domain-containing protein [Lachnospiraceae bacterium]|nr:SH3 domain-containing protein [Lachnospiraceae bacterium]
MRENTKSRMRSILYKAVIGCAALALVCGAGIESLAAKEGKITTEMANIRQSASSSAMRMGQIPAGTEFVVTGEETDSNGRLWYEISYYYEAKQNSGWIRSDLVEITSEGEETPGETGAEGTLIGWITIREPETLPEENESFAVSQVTIGDASYTALAVDAELTGGAEFYLVYGVDSTGAGGWYCYDAEMGTLQQDAGQFAGSGSEGGLVEALRQENESLQESHEKEMAVRKYIIMGLGALLLILLVVIIVLAVKLSQIEYVDEEEEEALEQLQMKSAKAETYAAKTKKEPAREEPVREETPAKAPEKQAAAKAVEAQAEAMTADKYQISEDDYDDSEEFDIELVDLDDLD